MTSEQKDLMAEIDMIAERCGVSVSTYPGPMGRVTLSAHAEEGQPSRELVAALNEAGISARYGYGYWPALWGRD